MSDNRTELGLRLDALGLCFCKMPGPAHANFTRVHRRHVHSELTHSNTSVTHHLHGRGMLKRSNGSSRGSSLLELQSSPCSDSSWLPLTTGDAAHSRRRVVRAEMVVSHCKKDLSWLEEAIRQLAESSQITVVSVNVYTKCNASVGPLPANAKVTVLPNAGRNDHAFAHHLASRSTANLQPLIFFLKDTTWGGSDPLFFELGVPLSKMADAALGSFGFGCGRRPGRHDGTRRGWGGSGIVALINAATNGTANSKRIGHKVVGKDRQNNATPWHLTAEIASFKFPLKMKTYAKDHNQVDNAASTPFHSVVRPLASWVLSLSERRGLADSEEAIGSSNERDGHLWLLDLFDQWMLPVCYGGSFATTRRQVKQVQRDLWWRIERSLERGDNIEESHYMERMWAALLAARLNAPSQERLLCATHRARCSPGTWFNALPGELGTCADMGSSRGNCSLLGRHVLGGGQRICEGAPKTGRPNLRARTSWFDANSSHDTWMQALMRWGR